MVEKDHRNILRIVGQIWRQMDDKQREPWADEEKVAYSKLYPSYRFSTGTSNKKPKRSSSCLPGTLHTSQLGKLEQL